MTRSKSKAEDDQRSKGSADRVSKEHGGEVVEAIAPEELELMNDPECKHDNLVRDETETDFNAFQCSNSKCGIVVLFDK